MLEYQEIESINLREKFLQDFSVAFSKIKNNNSYSEIAFLCVGTDRITGDCFGPLVGTKLTNLLEKDNFSNINVYGNLQNNINYTNIDKVVKKINDNTCIVVIDSALSKKENIGKIIVSNKKTILGKGLNKNKIEIGDISVKCVVAKDYKIPNYNFKVLQNISLNAVMSLANIVSEGIYEIIKNN